MTDDQILHIPMSHHTLLAVGWQNIGLYKNGQPIHLKVTFSQGPISTWKCLMISQQIRLKSVSNVWHSLHDVLSILGICVSYFLSTVEDMNIWHCMSGSETSTWSNGWQHSLYAPPPFPTYTFTQKLHSTRFTKYMYSETLNNSNDMKLLWLNVWHAVFKK